MAVSHEQRLELARFALAVLGIGLLGYGAWLHYPPLGYAVAGGMLLLMIFIGKRRAT